MNRMILGENQIFSLDCHKTQLNNNVLIVGTSGSGKTRSVVTPNILEATGSYVISDPKGSLYKHYGDYLQKKGYKVKKLDFINHKDSCHYNFFEYIHDTRDIVKMAHILMAEEQASKNIDPFWTEASEILLQAVMAFLFEACRKDERTLAYILEMVSLCRVDENDSDCKTPLDIIFDDYRENEPDSFAVRQYKKFRIAAGKTLKSILISINAKLATYDIPEIREMTKTDDVDISSIGDEKTALFVVVSDTDRSLDGLANIFFTQAMNELCRHADNDCRNESLPQHVRFIMDDFATNCKIYDFPRMIASIRSRNISAMIIIQAESQLKAFYKEDDKTIIGNCDSYLYLGCNDVDTATAISKRANVPLAKILYMPVGTNWLFRRGQEPVNGINLKLEHYIARNIMNKESVKE